MYSYSDTTSAVTWLRIEGSVPVQSLDLSTWAVSTREARRIRDCASVEQHGTARE
jgi:hypothetical protein